MTESKATNSELSKNVEAAYSVRYQDCHNLLNRLLNRLVEIDKASETKTWEHVGTLGKVRKDLAVALAMLGDTTAVREFGVPY